MGNYSRNQALVEWLDVISNHAAIREIILEAGYVSKDYSPSCCYWGMFYTAYLLRQTFWDGQMEAMK